jgi:hypothetical protein
MEVTSPEAQQSQLQSFGWAVVAVTMFSMVATVVIMKWMNDGNLSIEVPLAALIVGAILSIPTRLTALHFVVQQRPAALVTAGVSLAIYAGLLLLGSALSGRFVFSGNDLFYSGITAIAVFLYVKANEHAAYPIQSDEETNSEP